MKPKTKQCSKCKHKKPLEEFFCEVLKEDIPYCKTCLGHIIKEREFNVYEENYVKPLPLKHIVKEPKKKKKKKISYIRKPRPNFQFDYKQMLKIARKKDETLQDFEKNVGYQCQLKSIII